MDIRTGDLDHPAVLRLLQEHLRAAALHSPPESVHALGLEALRHPSITFWSVWQEGALLGCGALKEIDSLHAEIKSMRTASMYQKQGIAATLLTHILGEAERRRYRRLSLETGSADAFAPARRLYARFGFAPCAPFANYAEDPYSLFMTRELHPAALPPAVTAPVDSTPLPPEAAKSDAYR